MSIDDRRGLLIDQSMNSTASTINVAQVRSPLSSLGQQPLSLSGDCSLGSTSSSVTVEIHHSPFQKKPLSVSCVKPAASIGLIISIPLISHKNTDNFRTIFDVGSSSSSFANSAAQGMHGSLLSLHSLSNSVHLSTSLTIFRNTCQVSHYSLEKNLLSIFADRSMESTSTTSNVQACSLLSLDEHLQKKHLRTMISLQQYCCKSGTVHLKNQSKSVYREFTSREPVCFFCLLLKLMV